MTRTIDGIVDPKAVVSIRDAVQFEVRERFPELEVELPELTSESADSSQVELRLLEDEATAFVTLKDESGAAGSFLALSRSGDVWYVSSSQSCTDFVRTHDGQVTNDSGKSFEPTDDKGDEPG